MVKEQSRKFQTCNRYNQEGRNLFLFYLQIRAQLTPQYEDDSATIRQRSGK